MSTLKIGRKVLAVGALTTIALGLATTAAGAAPKDPCADFRHWSDMTAWRMQTALTYEEWDAWYTLWEANEEFMENGC